MPWMKPLCRPKIRGLFTGKMTAEQNQLHKLLLEAPAIKTTLKPLAVLERQLPDLAMVARETEDQPDKPLDLQQETPMNLTQETTGRHHPDLGTGVQEVKAQLPKLILLEMDSNPPRRAWLDH